MASINGQIIVPMKGLGGKISFTEKACTVGLTGENTMDFTLMIRSKVSVPIFGLMAENTRAIGIMENNMVKGNLLIVRVNLKQESGIMAKE